MKNISLEFDINTNLRVTKFPQNVKTSLVEPIFPVTCKVVNLCTFKDTCNITVFEPLLKNITLGPDCGASVAQW